MRRKPVTITGAELNGEGGSEVGHFYTVCRPRSIFGGGSAKLVLYEATTADSPP